MSTTDTEGLHPDDLRRRLPSITTPLSSDTERDERLRGIQERVQAATEGPWVETYPQSRTIVSEPDDQIVVDSFNDGIGAGVLGRTDALFIAQARTDVPWLLAEVTRLDAVVTAVRGLHPPVQHWTGPTVCDGCSDDGDLGVVAYPCPTVRALDGGAR